MSQYKAMDIANLLIQMGNAMGDRHIDNLKLNKMLYFAQGHCLSKYGTPLFDEAIEAWEHGPVVAEVYHRYKNFGYERIDAPSYHIDQKSVDPSVLKILLDTYRICLNCTGGDLEGISHVIDGPWRSVYCEGMNNHISTKAMTDYFVANDLSDIITPSLPTRCDIPTTSEIKTISDDMNKRWSGVFCELAK